MNLNLRNRSIITGKDNLELLYQLKSFPVFIGCTSNKNQDDIFADMTWMICKDSGMIQLEGLLPLELVYSEYHSEGIGSTWELHHQEFSKFIKKYAQGNIVEIGGSNGSLAKKYNSEYDENSLWTIIEPNPSFEGNKNIKIIKAFFNEKIDLPNCDTIVHSHVLEHLVDPNILLNHINKQLPCGGLHIFSIPNLYCYLKKKYTNSINFEHTYFLTEYFADYLLNKFGFEIIEKSYFQEHSIFYSTKKNNAVIKTVLSNKYSEYKRLYLDMIDYYDLEIKRLNRLIDEFEGKVFLFGGHIFSQFLIYVGLNQSRIECIIDNSKIKQNKRLYGTKLAVTNPDIIANMSEVAVILKAGQYQNEVKNQLLQINNSVEIWE